MLLEQEAGECKRGEGGGESVMRGEKKMVREEQVGDERESWRGSPCNAPPPARK